MSRGFPKVTAKSLALFRNFGLGPLTPTMREDSGDDAHLFLMHLVAIPRVVVALAVVGTLSRDDLALPRLPKLPAGFSRIISRPSGLPPPRSLRVLSSVLCSANSSRK